MINREAFFAEIKQSLFAGHLSQLQVDGINIVLDEWEKREPGDERWLAYMLATIYHECDKTMQPIKEKGGEQYLRNKHYYPYFGRGFVQLTWINNYRRFESILGVSLVNVPDNALEPAIATKILFIGMIDGLFTGKKLSHYFDAEKEDAIDARRIINGLDCAEKISAYYGAFKEALMPLVPGNIS